MTVQSWMLRSWPIVEWRPGARGSTFPDLWHVNTRTREGRGDRVLAYGDTVWLGEVDGKSVGVSWEWIEIRPGVVLLSDPNSIHTNISMISGDSLRMDELQSITLLNSMVHELPWQGAVCAVLAADSQRHELAISRKLASTTRKKSLTNLTPMLGHKLVTGDVSPALG